MPLCAFVTAICGHIERTETLVCRIFYCLFVFSHCCFQFGYIVGESHPFFGFLLFFFRNHDHSPFLLDQKWEKYFLVTLS
jgi:hypothetical protein